MYDYCAIEDDQLLIKKVHKGHLITLYLKVEGINMNLIDNKSIKKLSYFAKKLSLLNKKGTNNE